MTLKFFKIIAINCLLLIDFACQSQPQKAALQLIQDYNEATLQRNLPKMKSLWIHDNQVFTQSIGKGFYTKTTGWVQIEKRLDSLVSLPSDSLVNYGTPQIIRSGKDFAIIEYTPTMYSATDNSNYQFQVSIVAINQKEAWKIASRTVTHPDSYLKNAANTENEMTNLGYTFLEQNELKKAIEVFKLLVKFYPNNWNSYDSLGEAYAKAGDKKMAIENYEKSLQLNPKNKNGIEALKNLKNK